MWLRLRVKWPLFLSDLTELEYSRQIFGKKKVQYKISSKSTKWESSRSMRTDGHDEANKRFSQFCERAYKPMTCDKYMKDFNPLYLFRDVMFGRNCQCGQFPFCDKYGHGVRNCNTVPRKLFPFPWEGNYPCEAVIYPQACVRHRQFINI
jgi:hypothetical protein